ncbi:unnamed protein product, partial [Polarella glacialis]
PSRLRAASGRPVLPVLLAAPQRVPKMFCQNGTRLVSLDRATASSNGTVRIQPLLLGQRLNGSCGLLVPVARPVGPGSLRNGTAPVTLPRVAETGALCNATHPCQSLGRTGTSARSRLEALVSRGTVLVQLAEEDLASLQTELDKCERYFGGLRGVSSSTAE